MGSGREFGWFGAVMEQYGYASRGPYGMSQEGSFREPYMAGRANHDVVAPNEPRPLYSPAGGLGPARNADSVLGVAGFSASEARVLSAAARTRERELRKSKAEVRIGGGIVVGSEGARKYVPPGDAFTLDVTSYVNDTGVGDARGKTTRRRRAPSAVRDVSRQVNLHGTAGHAHQLMRGTAHVPAGDGAEGARPSGRGNVHGSRLCREFTLEPPTGQRRSRSPSPEPRRSFSGTGVGVEVERTSRAVSLQLASGLDEIARVRQEVAAKATMARKLAVSNPVSGGAGRNELVLDEDERRFGAVPEVSDLLEGSDIVNYGYKGYGALVGARAPLAPGFMTVHRAPGAQGGYAPVLKPVRKVPVWKTGDMLKSRVMDQRMSVEEIALQRAESRL